MGVKDGLVATATKGKSTRDGEHYQLGDLTRGVLTSMQEKRTQRKQRQDAARTMDDAFDAYSFNDTTTSTNATTSTNDASNTTNSSNIYSNNNSNNNNHQFVRTNSGRYASMVGSSAGAAAGLSLVGGPIGLLAGSLVGGKATREAVRRTNSSTAAENCANNNNDNDNDEEILRQLDQGRIQTQSQEQLLLEHMEAEKPSFRLGDNLRGIVKRGKQSSGRDVDTPYQFGDFSRGLFGRK
jgi:hypothetical protein